MSVMASQITSLTVVYSTVYSDTNQRTYQTSASLNLVREIHQSPVNSPHKGPVARNTFSFDDVIMWPQQNDTLAARHRIDPRIAWKLGMKSTPFRGWVPVGWNRIYTTNRQVPSQYHKICNIRLNKYQNLNVSRLSLQLSIYNPLKPSVKWRMKM